MNTGTAYTVSEIAAKLSENVEALCRELLPSGHRDGNEWRCGNVNGEPGRSLGVHLTGQKMGVWAEFNGGSAKGDALDLVQSVLGFETKRETANWALTWLGMYAGNGRTRAQRTASPASSARPTSHPKLGPPDTIYDYHDAAGGVVLHVYRWERTETKDKEFRPLHFDGKVWKWGDPKGLLPLYRLPDLKARPDTPVLVVEGEKAAEAATMLAEEYVVTTWPHGAQAIAKVDITPLEGRRVVLFPDADDVGVKAMRGMAERLRDIAAEVRFAEPLKELGAGADIADATTPERIELVLGHIAEARDARAEHLRGLGIVSAADLLAAEFSPVRWIAEPYLPEGLAILAGKPKVGKSWLALELAMSVAAGTPAMGNVEVEAGAVLYLALEDNNRRLQKRMRAVLQGAPAPPDLDLVTSWRKLNDGGLDDVDVWLKAHPDARLVVIDTLARVRERRKNNSDLYDADYDSVTGLKTLADKYSVAILLVHHLRKAVADDPLDEVSGSTGLTGAADSILLLKRDRGEMDAVLMAIGRDIEDIESAMKFDPDTCLWTVLGDADDYRRSPERNDILRVIRDSETPLQPKKIAEMLGKKEGNVRFLIKKLADEGVIEKLPNSGYVSLK